GISHLGAAVADRVVPQAGHAVDELPAVLVPYESALTAFDADEAFAIDLGEWVDERCGHVTTVSNRLESSRVAPTLRRRGGAGAPNRDEIDANGRASDPHAASGATTLPHVDAGPVVAGAPRPDRRRDPLRARRRVRCQPARQRDRRRAHGCRP